MRFRTIIGVAPVLAVMVWLAARGDDWTHAYSFAGRQDDYYSLLAHGLMKGHLYMDMAVDPRALSSDPEIQRLAGFVQDASLYHGKYYLYFGVVPAALVLLPYRLLTGQDLSANAACLAIVLLGFLLYLRIYAEARRRYFPALSLPLRACSVLLLAFGAGTPALLMISYWYEIAIAGGYACMAMAWLGLFRALHSERHAAGWLGLASVALGLAVGCRPTYVIALPVLVGAALVLARGAARGRAARTRVRLTAAAVLPAGLIGLLLAGYNYARFGNPLEFGIRYKLGDPSAMSLSFFWSNLKWYYLSPPTLSPYFSYFYPIHAQSPPQGYGNTQLVHGQWLTFLLALLCGIPAILSFRRGPAPANRLTMFLRLVAGGFACMFAGLGCFGGCSDRYLVDFQGSLVLLLALIGGYCAVSSQAARGWPHVWRAGFGVLAAASSLFNVLISLNLQSRFELTRPRSYHFFAYYGNYPAELLSRLGLLRYGPIRFKVIFTPVAQPTTGPLIATGVPYYTDVVSVTQYPKGLVKFIVAHAGYGSVSSGLFPMEPGRAYDIEADLGSLYPPKIDPYFNGWSDRDIARLKTAAFVRFNGQEAINQRLKFYDAPPGTVRLGRNPAEGDAPFNGKILSLQRLPPPARTGGPGPSESGVWRLRIEISGLPANGSYPILGSGIAGKGNLLLVQVARDGKLRFGLDYWGVGLDLSPAFPPPAPGPHVLEIFVGSQVTRHNFPAEWRVDAAKLRDEASVLRLWLDGVPVWDAPIQYNLDSYDMVSLGTNPQGFTSAYAYFLGSLASVPYASGEMREFIAKNARLAPSIEAGEKLGLKRPQADAARGER